MQELEDVVVIQFLELLPCFGDALLEILREPFSHLDGLFNVLPL